MIKNKSSSYTTRFIKFSYLKVIFKCRSLRQPDLFKKDVASNLYDMQGDVSLLNARRDDQDDDNGDH